MNQVARDLRDLPGGAHRSELASRRIVLFCAPYAGASSAIFRDWQRSLPEWVELVPLQLPGRGVKYSVPPFREWAPLIDQLFADVSPYLERPFGIFGHSMGALIGLELAHAIRGRRGVEPLWLGASACTAPSRRSIDAQWLTCSSESVAEHLRALGGTPEVVLQDASLFDALLPVLRADFHLCGTYPSVRRAPLNGPIFALGGADDDVSNPRDNLLSWSQETHGAFQLEIVDGGHFFIETDQRNVIGLISESLAKATSGLTLTLTPPLSSDRGMEAS